MAAASEQVKNPNGWITIIIAALMPVVLLVMDIRDNGTIDDVDNYAAVQDIVDQAVAKALEDAGVLRTEDNTDTESQSQEGE